MNLHSIRNPNDFEQAVFGRLTEVAYPGRETIKRQLEKCQVGRIDEDGSLKVHTLVLEKATVLFRVPIEATVKDIDGINIHYVLHVLDGKVNELEIYKDDASRIRSIPAPEKLELIVYPIKG